MDRTVVWRDAALDDLERIDAWLATLDHAQPENVRARIGAAVHQLERLGDIGRPGREPDTRELSVRRAPYVIVYRATEREIEIVAVYHMVQNR